MRLQDTVAQRRAAVRPAQDLARAGLSRLARGAGLLMALAVPALVVVGLPRLFAMAATAGPATNFPFWQVSAADTLALQTLGVSLDVYAAYRIALQLTAALAFAAAAVLVWRRPRDPLALLAACTLLALGTLQSLSVLMVLSAAEPAFAPPVNFLITAAFPCLALFLYVFPDGRWQPRWARIPVLLGILALLIWVVGPGGGDARTRGPVGLLDLTGILGGVVAQIYRYLRVSDRLQRQQTKWVVAGAVVAMAALVIEHAQSTLWFWAPPWFYYVIHPLLFNVAFVAVAASLSVATLQYRLWDLDRFIARTLVYAALSLFVAAVYLLFLSGWGPPLGPGALVLAILATGLIALLLRPLRERFQRAANQLLFGAREDPYAILAQLGRRLEAVIDPLAVLPTVVETVADALTLPYVELALRQGREWRVAAAHGTRPAWAGELRAFPLLYGQDTVGELRVAPRAPREALTAGDLALLAHLARQAGSAAHAVQLTGELERSLQRIVNAREEARRQLGSDLHDGLGHSLAGLLRKAETAANLLQTQPADADGAARLLGELQGQAHAAIDEVRALAHTLHPPELELLGLSGALRERTRDFHQTADSAERLHIVVEAPERLPALPAAVEAAAYYIAQEALTNVTRHAGARRCRVRLRLAGAEMAVPRAGGLQPVLELEVSDDGRGLGCPEEAGGAPGLGFTSMRERATELGGTCLIETLPTGGTRVFARLPYPPL